MAVFVLFLYFLFFFTFSFLYIWHFGCCVLSVVIYSVFIYFGSAYFGTNGTHINREKAGRKWIRKQNHANKFYFYQLITTEPIFVYISPARSMMWQRNVFFYFFFFWFHLQSLDSLKLSLLFLLPKTTLRFFIAIFYSFSCDTFWSLPSTCRCW